MHAIISAMAGPRRDVAFQISRRPTTYCYTLCHQIATFQLRCAVFLTALFNAIASCYDCVVLIVGPRGKDADAGKRKYWQETLAQYYSVLHSSDVISGFRRDADDIFALLACKGLPLDAALHPRRAQIKSDMDWPRIELGPLATDRLKRGTTTIVHPPACRLYSAEGCRCVEPCRSVQGGNRGWLASVATLFAK
jgi:hypothetical protein